MKNTKQIYDELRKTVIGQDDYLKELAIISYKHLLKQKLIENGIEPLNSNLLVIGPSGCGKTLAVKTLAKIIDVPFCEVDCANLVQVGYKGTTNIEDSLSRCIKKYHEDAFKAIIYLDEFDKILDLALLKDGKGTGSQQNFLKILESNTIDINTSERLSSTINFDTKGLTFIATGSFEMVKANIRNRNVSTMGFKTIDKQLDSIELNDEDLIEFGYMPELIGRFTRILNINQLNVDDYYNILKYGEDSVCRQYEKLLMADGVGLQIKNKVFKNVAQQTYGKSVGVRGMNRYISEIMDKCLFDISNDKKINKVVIDCKDNELYADYICGKTRNNKNNSIESNDFKIDINELRDFIVYTVELTEDVYNDQIKRELLSMVEPFENYIYQKELISIFDKEINDLDEMSKSFAKVKTRYFKCKKDVCLTIINEYQSINKEEEK